MLEVLKLEEVFDKISINMRNKFEEARLAIGSNSGVKGDANEGTFRTFLKDYLPPSFDVLTGIIVDSLGNQSRQLDVIITDKNKTPIFYQSEDNVRVIPVEPVLAVIEVKAFLDWDEVEKSLENMKSVKKLQKLSYVKQKGLVKLGVKMHGKFNEIWPVNYYIFAYDSIKLPHITFPLADLYTAEKTPLQERIDTICVLDKGLVTNQLADKSLSITSEPPAKLVSAVTKRSLLLFYTLLTSNLFHADLPKIDLNEYTRKVKW